MKDPRPAVGIFLALVLGFVVADLTDQRWLGGIVLVAIGVIAGYYMVLSAGWVRTILATAVALGAFALSHPMGAVLGSYGSLLLVSAVAGVVVYAITPRRYVA